MRIFGFVGVTWCGDPTFLAYPRVFLTCSPFIGVLGFFSVRQGNSCVDVDRHDDYSADSDLLRNFSFYSWASLLVLPFLLRLPILLSLSPKVTSLGGF